MFVRGPALLLASIVVISSPASAAFIVGRDGTEPNGGPVKGTPDADTIHGDPVAGMGPVTAVKRVSTASPDANGVEAEANDGASEAAISPDGQWMAFRSKAQNLVAGTFETDTSTDLYLKNLKSGVVTRLSAPAFGTELDGHCYEPVFSPDGTRVAFSSTATNLLPQGEDGNTWQDVFVVTLADGSIRRVSIAEGDSVAGDGPSIQPVFSPDGTKIAFSSAAHNLMLSPDTNELLDVFVKDIGTSDAPDSGAVQKISNWFDEWDNEYEAFGGESYHPAFSPDGKKVAFASTATTLLPNSADTNGHADVFVRDIAGGTIERVSLGSAEAQAVGGDSGHPVYSPD